jgi:hypothetical protein
MQAPWWIPQNSKAVEGGGTFRITVGIFGRIRLVDKNRCLTRGCGDCDFGMNARQYPTVEYSVSFSYSSRATIHRTAWVADLHQSERRNVTVDKISR